MSYLDTKIQFYPASVYESAPIGVCTLADMLTSIKNPKPKILETFKLIEKASLEKNKKEKDRLKATLYYFTPCIWSNGNSRKYSDIVSWSGLAILDFDNLEVDQAIKLKQFIFDEYSFVIASFLSSSKQGVKAIVRIPVVKSVDEFKSYFYGLMVTFQWVLGADASAQNSSLPNYLTYDYDILIRNDATVFNKTGYKEDEFKVYEGEITIVDDVSEDDRETIKYILRKSFEKITDSGHYICRSACLAGFGYCGAGYFDTEEMREYLYELIEDTPYLQSKVKAYKQTCDDMIVRGLGSPLYLEKHAQ